MSTKDEEEKKEEEEQKIQKRKKQSKKRDDKKSRARCSLERRGSERNLLYKLDGRSETIYPRSALSTKRHYKSDLLKDETIFVKSTFQYHYHAHFISGYLETSTKVKIQRKTIFRVSS